MFHYQRSPRWKDLRTTEGWSILQHHALLHTEVQITPPKDPTQAVIPPLLTANVVQASFFRLCVRGGTCRSPWQNGNVYAMPSIPNQIIPYPAEVTINQTTVFDLYVSGDFEIRLFGDPVVVEGQEIPIQRLIVQLSFLATSDLLPVLLEEQLDVIPDFVDGQMFSVTQVFGIGLKSANGWWCTDTVTLSTNQVCLAQVSQTSTDPFLGLGGFPL